LLRNFVVAQVAVIAQRERYPVLVRQGGDGLAYAVASFVGDHLLQRRGLVHRQLQRLRRLRLEKALLELPPAQAIHAIVTGDAQQPARERQRFLVTLDGLGQPREHFAGGVLGVLMAPHQVPAQSKNPRPEKLIKLAKSFRVVIQRS
jgi:hypothetical protein